MERVIFILALVMLGVIGVVIVLKPAFTIEFILRFFLPGWHLVKNRKKAKKKVKKVEEKKEEKEEEVFP
jgi:flagellar biosynthesis component FlhA